jgi:D-alanine transaminase
MSRIAYVNGRYLPHREAAVSIEDRGYQFADGVYEVIPVLAGRLIDEGLHLDRLARSLAEVRIASPMSRAALGAVLREVAWRNRVRDGMVYLQVTRGVARREHPFPAPRVPPALVVTARRGARVPDAPDGWGIAAITWPDERWARCDIKTIGLLPNVLARQAAREQGAYEAVLVDGAGNVTEGAAANIWIVDDAGVLRTRALDPAILPGCTRAALIGLLQKEDIGFEERGFSLAELRAAREAFLTSATSFVRPVLRLDGAPIGDGEVGPVTRRLFALFAAHVGGKSNHADP